MKQTDKPIKRSSPLELSKNLRSHLLLSVHVEDHRHCTPPFPLFQSFSSPKRAPELMIGFHSVNFFSFASYISQEILTSRNKISLSALWPILHWYSSQIIAAFHMNAVEMSGSAMWSSMMKLACGSSRHLPATYSTEGAMLNWASSSFHTFIIPFAHAPGPFKLLLSQPARRSSSSARNHLLQKHVSAVYFWKHCSFKNRRQSSCLPNRLCD